MAYDGTIRFNTRLDNSNIEKDLRELERKIQKAEESVSKNENEKLPLVKQAKELGNKLDEAKYKAARLKSEMASIDQAMSGGSAGDYTEAVGRKGQVAADLKAQEAEVETLQKQWDKLNDKIDRYDHNIKMAKDTIARSSEKAAILTKQMNGSGAAMANAFARAKTAALGFEKRVIAIGKRVLVFTLIANAFRAIKDYMGKALKTNKEYTTQLAKLKAALVTAFQPLYEFILPGLIASLRVLTTIASVLANLMSILFGKTLAQSAESAKKLNEEADALENVSNEAKKAKGNLAGFDEINRMGSGSSTIADTGDTPTYNFEDFNSDEYKKKIDELTVYLEGALLAIGAILTFSGANIPLGITLMGIGAAALAKDASLDWACMKTYLEGANGLVVGVLSGAMLAIGAILAFSGANIPLGIVLMAAGAAGLAASVAANWNSIVTALRGPLGLIVGIAGSMLLALGLVLAFSGAALPLGLGLMVAGGAALGAAIAPNWNFLKEKVSGEWKNIVSYWKTNIAPKLTKEYWVNKIFSGISAALPETWKAAINKVITQVNKFIDWLNDTLKFEIPTITVAGIAISKATTISLVNIPNIPYLAQGAVIPPNREFMAVLGDQKHGTNIEAPLETIQEAVAIVMEDMIQSNIAGHEATVAILREILEAILGIHIGDDVIGKAVARYNSKMAIIRGGNT